MIKQSSFTQETESREWLHLVEAPNKNISVLSVHTLDGRSTFNPGSYGWDVQDGMIKIDFGVSPEAGVAIFEYDDMQTPENPQVVQDGYGNNVTITVTQNGGGVPSGSTF